MVTGGTRSGKSEEAERRALSLSDRPVYLATATVQDEEMAERVRRHQERRRERWINLEEPLHLGRFDFDRRVVLLDCLTLWCTNVFFEMGEDVDRTLDFMKQELQRLVANPSVTYIMVTNELGMGGVSPNAMMRKFADLQGWLNQYVAAMADEVVLMISGIPVKIK